MNKNDCIYDLTLNYDVLEKDIFLKRLNISIELCSNIILKHTRRCSANKIISHPINEYILKNLISYDKDTNKINNKCFLIFNDECEIDTIYVYNDYIENPKGIYYKTISNTNGLMELTITFDPLEIEQEKRNYCTYITFLNYNSIKLGR